MAYYRILIMNEDTMQDDAIIVEADNERALENRMYNLLGPTAYTITETTEIPAHWTIDHAMTHTD